MEIVEESKICEDFGITRSSVEVDPESIEEQEEIEWEELLKK